MSVDQSIGVNKMVAAWCECMALMMTSWKLYVRNIIVCVMPILRKVCFLNSLTRKREDKDACFEQHRTTPNNYEQLP